MKIPAQLKISPWGLLSAIGAVACLFTVTGFAGSSGWLLDLPSHFRLQYAGILLLVSALLCIPRRFGWAIAFLCFALVNVALILPLYLNHPRSPSSHAQSIRALLANVHTQNQERGKIKALIRQTAPDFFLLQEVNDPAHSLLRLSRSPGRFGGRSR